MQSFSLFMHSLAKPDKYYQVFTAIASLPFYELTPSPHQIFLSQGIGAGLGAGMLYVPSMAVLSHYFGRRRSLALTMAAAGSSLGAIVHPVMLNNTLDRVGFAVAARANAGLISVMLLTACLLMRTRLGPPENLIDLWKAARRFSTDLPFMFASVAYVAVALRLETLL